VVLHARSGEPERYLCANNAGGQGSSPDEQPARLSFSMAALFN
jgi:hypothetical protein